jgi:2-polyprenyl-6-methoxyphenol hydroxylase-like FAD-dependent oxidoreductase
LVAAGGQLRTQTRAHAPDLRPGLVCTTGRRRSGSAWLGLKIHARNLSLERDLELHLGHGAYIGLTKVEGERVNLCGLFPRRELSARGPELIIAHLRAANLDGLADRLAGADFDHESFSAVAAVGFDRHFPPAAGLALGDAAAMIPPFTGNGMAMAFESAAHALGPLVLYCHGSLDWPTAAQTIQAALRRHFRLRLAAAGLLHPFLLQAPHQRWLTRLARAHLLPFRPLYSVLH